MELAMEVIAILTMSFWTVNQYDTSFEGVKEQMAAEDIADKK